MFHFRKTFEEETAQLQELNKRLSQYLSRVKQLEQENAVLIAEINAIRGGSASTWEDERMAELRELRGTVDRLSYEKFKAEMERQKLWREFKELEALRCQESGVCGEISGELNACEERRRQEQRANGALQTRLLQLQEERTGLRHAHRRDVARLRDQARPGALPVFVQKCPQPPEISMEEFDRYARALSETWREAEELYCKGIADMEESLRSDEAKLETLRREKMQYTSEVKKLNNEVEKQKQLRLRLDEQLRNMQANFPKELHQYQVITEELEDECRMLANAISKKLRDHQDLMQIKMGLSLEVATYRALLESERTDEHMWTDHHTTEPLRKIDIKMPPHPYTPKGASMSKQDGRTWKPSNMGFDTKYIEPTSHTKVSSGVTRIVPITVYGVGQQSSLSRKEPLSITRASQASMSIVKGVLNTEENVHTQKKIIGERTALHNKSQHSTEDSVISQQEGLKVTSKFGSLATEDSKSVRVASPSTVSMALNINDDKQGTTHIKVEKTNLEKESELNTVSMTQGKNTAKMIGNIDKTAVTEDCLARDKIESQVSSSQLEHKCTVKEAYVEHRPLATEENVLESMSVEEIIEKVVKPAGLDTKVTCQMEKSEQEDGRLKTEIILQSKVEEDLDVSDESFLEELLSKEVKKVVLEDIKGTPTGSMIENLLSLGRQGEKDLKNKSVNIEIVEEPVDSVNDEECKVKKTSLFNQPSSLFFAIEELTNVDESSRHSDEEENRALVTPGEYEKISSVHIEESSGDLGAALFSQDQETEYFVSTPDDDISESDDVPLSSYGHYGALDDLSDERYYQDGGLISQRFKKDEHYEALPKTTYVGNEHVFSRDSFPDCIIEEEVHVSPTVQESLLEFLRKDNMDPKEYLQGTLGQLQGTISGTVKEELALFTKTDQEGSGNLAVDIRKVQQAKDSGTVTIVAELNISQSLEGSGLLEEQGTDVNFEEKLLSALHSCNPGLQQIISSRSEVTVSEEIGEHLDGKVAGYDQEQELPTEDPTNQMNKTEKHIKLGPSEKSFTFQMEDSNVKPSVSCGSVREAWSSQGLSVQEDNSHEVKEDIIGYVEKANTLVNQDEAPSLEEGHVNEKRIATVYLESQEHN